MTRNATHITRDQFVQAIAASDGTYKDIAARLGIDRGTLRRYRRRRAYIQALCDRKREQMNLPIGHGLSEEAFKQAIESTNGNLVRAAEAIGRTPQALYFHMRKRPVLRQWRNAAYPPTNHTRAA